MKTKVTEKMRNLWAMLRWLVLAQQGATNQQAGAALGQQQQQQPQQQQQKAGA